MVSCSSDKDCVNSQLVTEKHVINLKETKWGNSLAVTKIRDVDVNGASQIVASGSCTIAYLTSTEIKVFGIGSDPTRSKVVKCAGTATKLWSLNAEFILIEREGNQLAVLTLQTSQIEELSVQTHPNRIEHVCVSDDFSKVIFYDSEHVLTLWDVIEDTILAKVQVQGVRKLHYQTKVGG